MRLAIAGLGGWGRNWAKLVQGLDAYDLVAVIDPSDHARSLAASALELPPESLYSDLDVALAQTTADAVLVLTPPDTHRHAAERALAAGKHVLIEKPVATTIEDALAIVAAADAAGRIAMVSQNYRYSRPARHIRKSILAGDIGLPLAIRNVFRYDMRVHLPLGDFRYAMHAPLLFDMSIHHFDLVRAMTGREAVRVDARSWTVGDTAFEHHPAAVAIITLDGGTTYSYDADWGTHRDNMPWSGEWEIIGSDGRIAWDGTGRDGEATRVDHRRWDGSHTVTEFVETGEDSREPTLATFANAIATGTEPETSARDNLRSLGLVLAAVASANRAEPVDLTEILAADGAVGG